MSEPLTWKWVYECLKSIGEELEQVKVVDERMSNELIGSAYMTVEMLLEQFIWENKHIKEDGE